MGPGLPLFSRRNCRVDHCGLPTESPFFFVRSRKTASSPREHPAIRRGSCAQHDRTDLAEREQKTTESPDRALEGDVREVVRPVLAAHGLELFDLSFRRERGGAVLRVMIDTPGTQDPRSCVTVDQCAEVSRDLSTALDVADPLPGAYTLEVSSPGVERPLRGRADYERFAGQPAKLTLFEPMEAVGAVVHATLRGVEGDEGSVQVGQSQPLSIPLASIKRAHLVYELPAQPKKSHSKKKRRPSQGRRT